MIAALKAKIQSKIANDKHFAELIRGSGVAFILRIVGIAAGYLFTLLVTRNLGSKVWGSFALSLVILQISSIIGRLGMDTALLRFTAEYVANGKIGILRLVYKKMLSFILVVSVLVSILVYFFSSFLACEVFHNSYLNSYFRVVSFIIVPFVLLWFHSEGIRGFKKIKEYMLLHYTGIFVICSILIYVSLFFTKWSLLPVITYSISIYILAAISICLWQRLLKTRKDNNESYVPNYMSILSISIPMLFSNSLTFIIGWTDSIMLGMFRDIQEVGIYSVVLKLAMTVSFTITSINTIAAPKFVEIWIKKNKFVLESFVQQTTKLSFLISFPILVVFLLFPRCILELFGREFGIGAFALEILTIGQLVNVISGSVGYILTMLGYQNIHQKILFFTTWLNIVLNLILIPIYGMYGAAVASAVAVIVGNIISVWYIKRFIGIRTYLSIWRM